MSETQENEPRNPTSLAVPPFATEETTPRGLYVVLQQLAAWSDDAMCCLTAEQQAVVNQHAPKSEMPEFELFAAVPVWHIYRVLRSVRAVRIGFDYISREYAGHPHMFRQHLFQLVLTARCAAHFTFQTPADMRARQFAEDRRRLDAFIARQTGEQT